MLTPAEQVKRALDYKRAVDEYGFASPLYGDDERWDMIAGRKGDQHPAAVTVGGVDCKNWCSAISLSRGEAFCFPHKMVKGDDGEMRVVLLDPMTAERPEDARMFIVHGTIEVTYADGRVLRSA